MALFEHTISLRTRSFFSDIGPALSSVGSKNPLTLILAYCYLVPLFCVIVLGATKIISPTAVTLLQGTFVTVLCCATGIVFLRKKPQKSLLKDISFPPLVLMAACVLLSISANGYEDASLLRGFLQVCFFFTMGLLIPNLLEHLPKIEIDKIAKIFVTLTLILVLLAVSYHLLGLSYNSRLVHPVNPHLWILLAWFICYRHFQNNLLAFVLAIALIWTGSRFSMATLCIGYFYFCCIQPRTIPWRKLVNTGMAIAATLAGLNFIIPEKSPLIRYSRSLAQIIPTDIFEAKRDTFEEKRETFEEKRARPVVRNPSSNRQIIIPDALEKLREPEAWWKGYSKEVKVPIATQRYVKKLTNTTVHNSFLRAALFYGLPYALLSYIVWFLRFMPTTVGKSGGNNDIISQFLFWIITLQSLLFSTFWTNMTDPPVFFACLWMLSSSSCQKHEATTIPNETSKHNCKRK